MLEDAQQEFQGLTAILRICCTNKPLDVERGSKGILGRLYEEILFSTRRLTIQPVYFIAEQLTSQ